MARYSHPEQILPATCDYCGSDFLTDPTTPAFYCSRTCKGLAMSREWLQSERAPKHGDQFGQWTVICYSHSEKGIAERSVHFFYCVCSCGRDQTLRITTLGKHSTRCLSCARQQPRAEPIEVGRCYGSWEVVAYAYRSEKTLHHYFRCRCECGTEQNVAASGLRSGTSTRCRRCVDEGQKRPDSARPNTRFPERQIWRGMLRRCENPKSHAWEDYGGRGIRVCERWKVFENFFADMGPRPGPEYSLDRIDNNAGYAPGNVQWRTWIEQLNNKRLTKYLTHAGKTQSVAQWARQLGFQARTLYERINRGWPDDAVLTTPLIHGRRPFKDVPAMRKASASKSSPHPKKPIPTQPTLPL